MTTGVRKYNKWTKAVEQRFLKVLATKAYGNVSEAARICNVDRVAAYMPARSDGFKLAFKKAVEDGEAAQEKKMIDNADDIKDMIVEHVRKVGIKDEPISASDAAKIAKAFGDKAAKIDARTVNNTQINNTQVNNHMDMSMLSDEELAQLQALMAKAQRAPSAEGIVVEEKGTKALALLERIEGCHPPK